MRREPLTKNTTSLTQVSDWLLPSSAMAHTLRCVMHGSVRSQVRRGPSSRPKKQRRTRLLRLATAHSRSTARGRCSSGGWKHASAVWWRSTPSRKKVQVRNSATSSELLSRALHVSSCSSHGWGRSSSEVGVGGGPGSDVMRNALSEEVEEAMGVEVRAAQYVEHVSERRESVSAREASEHAARRCANLRTAPGGTQGSVCSPSCAARHHGTRLLASGWLKARAPAPFCSVLFWRRAADSSEREHGSACVCVCVCVCVLSGDECDCSRCLLFVLCSTRERSEEHG